MVQTIFQITVFKSLNWKLKKCSSLLSLAHLWLETAVKLMARIMLENGPFVWHVVNKIVST